MGNKYTRENKHEGIMLIKEKLDHAMASKEWTEDFQQASMRHLNMEFSDHCPILLQTDKGRRSTTISISQSMDFE